MGNESVRRGATGDPVVRTGTGCYVLWQRWETVATTVVE